MSALILDGTKIAQDIRAEVAAEVRTMSAAGVRPGWPWFWLDITHRRYTFVEGKACEWLAFWQDADLPNQFDTVLTLIKDLNRRDEIDGIPAAPIAPAGRFKEVPLAVVQ
jgi:5,10-methylene-tetrahydrofolate dehydrogenase/methenyl tetrahydrofolate cyclohydrolase